MSYDAFSDGAVFVPLAPVHDPALVAATVAQVLEVYKAGDQPLQDLLLAYLYDKELLLVLDNFEQFIDAASLVGVLAAAPRLKILVTSRTLLRSMAHKSSTCPSLPDLHYLPDIAARSQYAAVALFIQRVQLATPDSMMPCVTRRGGRRDERRAPSAAIVDSQSVKTTEQGGPRGYDAGKKVKGRKRHLVVDTLGLLLVVCVLAANIQDRDGAKHVVARLEGRFPRLTLLWADGGYAGKLVDWITQRTGWMLQIVKRSDDVGGFVVLPKRWIVERTFAWLGRYRRLSKDDETRPQSGEAMVLIAMIQIMLRRRPTPGGRERSIAVSTDAPDTGATSTYPVLR